ncbi:MAG TPA: hypothetical protein PKJ24_06975, partial [Prolixibacteraceae bacterium]|nr:hypothetical protein [Prolixibacteraceae bacterium]
MRNLFQRKYTGKCHKGTKTTGITKDYTMTAKGLRFLCDLVPSWLIFIGLLSCLLDPTPVAGQNEPGGLYVSGKITTEEGNVDGSIIKMTRNGTALKDY